MGTPNISCTRLDNSISDYLQVLAGSIPGCGGLILRNCLEKIHKDIITCWNFKGEVILYRDFDSYFLDLRPRHQVLKSREFGQLMLRLIQDVVQTEPKD